MTRQAASPWAVAGVVSYPKPGNPWFPAALPSNPVFFWCGSSVFPGSPDFCFQSLSIFRWIPIETATVCPKEAIALVPEQGLLVDSHETATWLCPTKALWVDSRSVLSKRESSPPCSPLPRASPGGAGRAPQPRLARPWGREGE